MTTCDRCEYEWDYSGDLGTATCPNCNRKTSTKTVIGKVGLDPAGGAGQCWICAEEEDIEYHHVSYEKCVAVPLCREHHEEAHSYEEHPLHPVDERAETHIIIPVTDDEHSRLSDVKGGKTWRETLFEEFEVPTDA